MTPLSTLLEELTRAAEEQMTLPDDYQNRLARVAEEIRRFRRRRVRGQHSLPIKMGSVPPDQRAEEEPAILRLSCQPRLWRRLAMQQHPECAYCGRVLNDQKATADHVVPVSKGGLDEPANLVLACADCNSLKADQTPTQWAARILSAVGVTEGGAA